MRTLYWYVYFGISLFLQTPKLLKVNRLTKQGKLQERNDYVFGVTSSWARRQVRNSGATITVHGEENLIDGPVVFISNHQGNFDIALFMSYIPKQTGFVSKIEMAKAPLISTWMNLLHCVFMDRSTLKGAASAIVDGIKMIKAGHSLVIFPEGTRSRGDQMGEFKAGSFKLATKPGVPIIPVTIDGSYKLMERQGGKVTPDKVDIYIHPPIATKGLSKEEQNALVQQVQEIIQTKLPQ
ncbi:MAG: lysophospholipid acyltransferase family protein [Cellulosilyticaceae bacterium]